MIKKKLANKASDRNHTVAIGVGEVIFERPGSDCDPCWEVLTEFMYRFKSLAYTAMAVIKSRAHGG